MDAFLLISFFFNSILLLFNSLSLSPHIKSQYVFFVVLFGMLLLFFSLFSILNHIHWHVIELVQSARSIRSRNLRLHDSRDAFKRKYKCLEVLYCCQFALLCVCVYCVFVRPKSDTLTPN